MTFHDVIILSGGLGTRLAPVVSDRPKVLAEVNGQPFLKFLLDSLLRSGFKRVILAVGYRSELIMDVFGDDYHGMEIIYSMEESPLGTGGAIGAASAFVQTELVAVINGDSWCQVDHYEIFRTIQEDDLQVGIAITHVDDASRFGAIERNENGMVTRFLEKGSGVRPGWINAGIYYIRRNIFERVRDFNTPCSFEGTVLPSLIEEGIRTFPALGEFIDIGVPESYAAASAFFRRNLPECR
jgi:D-glycero-alpha-D-manno-heptose 1-phosphate guanylyltransferase